MLFLKRFFRNAFRSREMFIRVDGRVRYGRISSGVQVAAVVLVLAAIGWSVYATLAMQDRGDRIAHLNVQVAEIDRERRRLGGELAATRAYYSNAASEITRQYRELKRLAVTRGSLEGQLLSTQTQLAAIEREYQETRDRSEDLDRQVVQLSTRLQQRTSANLTLQTRLSEIGAALAGSTAGRQNEIEARRRQQAHLAFLENSLQNSATLNQSVRDRLSAQRSEMEEIEESREVALTEVRRLSSHMTALNSDLDEAYRTNSSLRRRLAATSDALTETHEHQVLAERRGQHLARTVGTLESRLEQVKATQLELLRGIREKAQANIAGLSATLAQTGIPMEELLTATIRRKTGLGGPLVALNEDIEGTGEDSFESMVGNLEFELLQWESMQTLLAHLPLTRPTKRGYVSSKYGARRDPISGRRAFHKGVDIAAPTYTPIYATAGGVVTFAGTKAAYGKIVEIDHGYGFTTKYAHLKKILVKQGQHVKFHDEIAKMGTTGRSTGSHVHYEVLFEGEHIDPVNFFEAGRHVFKVQNQRG